MSAVKYWTTRNDANHRNRHAQVGEVKFFAFPYQSYTSRVGDKLAIVGSTFSCCPDTQAVVKRWRVSILACHPDGSNTTVSQHRADSADDAFTWAAGQLQQA